MSLINTISHISGLFTDSETPVELFHAQKDNLRRDLSKADPRLVNMLHDASTDVLMSSIENDPTADHEKFSLTIPDTLTSSTLEDNIEKREANVREWLYNQVYLIQYKLFAALKSSMLKKKEELTGIIAREMGGYLYSFTEHLYNFALKHDNEMAAQILFDIVLRQLINQDDSGSIDNVIEKFDAEILKIFHEALAGKKTKLISNMLVGTYKITIDDKPIEKYFLSDTNVADRFKDLAQNAEENIDILKTFAKSGRVSQYDVTFLINSFISRAASDKEDEKIDPRFATENTLFLIDAINDETGLKEVEQSCKEFGFYGVEMNGKAVEEVGPPITVAIRARRRSLESKGNQAESGQ